MADEQVEFELVSPERLLLSKGVEMVVVPGAEGDFGVLPRHTPMVSNLRPGVIQVYEKGNVTERIFVAGGFAEVTPTRCTVLADQAMPVDELDRAATEVKLKDLREDLTDTKNAAARASAEKQIAVCEEILRIAKN